MSAVQIKRQREERKGESAWRVYSFPGALITNYHELGGLKQQTFIFSEFWSLKSEIRCWQDHSPSKAPGRFPSRLFPVSAGG